VQFLNITKAAAEVYLEFKEISKSVREE
jgi:hypothetical protein